MIIAVGILGLSYITYAGTSTPAKHEFKNTDREVNFDIERGQGEVVIHLQSNTFNSYDEIVVERSSTGSAGFTTCKTIDIAEAKIAGDYYKTIDKFPLPAKADSYYRIKIVTKDGSMKTFPPVLLEALSR